MGPAPSHRMSYLVAGRLEDIRPPAGDNHVGTIHGESSRKDCYDSVIVGYQSERAHSCLDLSHHR